jgi:hypothetical protein
VIDLLDLFAGNRPVEGAESAQAKAVPVSDLADFIDHRPGQFLPERKALEPALQRQRHRLSHTGVAKAWGETEIEIEIDLAGNFHHAPVDHEDVFPLRSYLM